MTFLQIAKEMRDDLKKEWMESDSKEPFYQWLLARVERKMKEEKAKKEKYNPKENLFI